MAPASPSSDDHEPDGDDDRVELGLAFQRTDQDAFDRGSEQEPHDQCQQEGPPVPQSSIKRLDATKVVIIAIAPCAKLMTFVARKMRTSARASDAKIIPSVSPLSV